MIFLVASVHMELYGKGKRLSFRRYEMEDKLKVFFYDEETIKFVFGRYGQMEYSEVMEPIKYIAGFDPIPLYQVICRKPF